MKYTDKEHLVKHYTEGRTSLVDTGVVHYVSAKNMEGFENAPFDINQILSMFADGVEWAGKHHYFSCHRIIDRNGDRYIPVHLKDTSWNAGKSFTDFGEYRYGINSCSIGYELVATRNSGFTGYQYESLAESIIDDNEQLKLQNLGHVKHLVGHDWIAGETAVKLGIKSQSAMKVDPGPLFDWDRLHDTIIKKQTKTVYIRRPFFNFFSRFRSK